MVHLTKSLLKVQFYLIRMGIIVGLFWQSRDKIIALSSDQGLNPRPSDPLPSTMTIISYNILNSSSFLYFTFAKF